MNEAKNQTGIWSPTHTHNRTANDYMRIDLPYKAGAGDLWAEISIPFDLVVYQDRHGRIWATSNKRWASHFTPIPDRDLAEVLKELHEYIQPEDVTIHPPEIDTDCQDEITCPYCGYVDGDSWEYIRYGEDQEVDCGACGTEMNLTIEQHITYTTQKIPSKKSS